MATSITLTPAEALRIISEAPDAADKTAFDLREAADDFERQADRKDRLAASRANGNRRAARLKAAKREGDTLRLHAQVARLAAEEVERRECRTVGEASKSAVVRAMRKALRMQDGADL